MLVIVIALDSAFATQLYVRLTTLSSSAVGFRDPRTIALRASNRWTRPELHPFVGTQFQAKGRLRTSSLERSAIL
jgi:hypothetical protein